MHGFFCLFIEQGMSEWNENQNNRQRQRTWTHKILFEMESNEKE